MQRSLRKTSPETIAKASDRNESGSCPDTTPPHSTSISVAEAITQPKDPACVLAPPSVARKMVRCSWNSMMSWSRLRRTKFSINSLSQSSACGKKKSEIC